GAARGGGVAPPPPPPPPPRRSGDPASGAPAASASATTTAPRPRRPALLVDRGRSRTAPNAATGPSGTVFKAEGIRILARLKLTSGHRRSTSPSTGSAGKVPDGFTDEYQITV